MLSAQTVLPNAFTTVVLAGSQGSATPAAGSSGPPSAAFTPTQIANAYGINQITFSNGSIVGNGAGQTIALIDAYNDPNIKTDLATFDSAFNLPAPPNFTVEGQTGTSQLPSNPTPSTSESSDPNDWSLEISLDVEWAHAIAPDANILLVEANSSSLTDLFTAASTAAHTSGVVVVSMSFGAGESAGELSDDSTFTTPSGHLGGSATTGGTLIAGGVTFVSSAGDAGTPGGYPAYSPNVLSVGGTSLTLNGSGGYGSETVWNDGEQDGQIEATGGGISTEESEPNYQDAVVPASDSNQGLNRAMPDVAFDADPNTGVGVVDSYDYYSGDSFGSSGSWIEVGGTSFGSPSWAALVAIADQGRAIDGLGSLDGASQTLPEIYTMPATDFHDITSGNNGTYSATTGYDLVTGRGTPVASSVVSYLVGFSVVATSPVAGSTSHIESPTSFTVTFSDAYSTAGLTASDFEVNGVGATSMTENSSTSITFNFSTSPVLNQVTQTMTIAAGAIDRSADDAGIQAYSQTFNYDPTSQLQVVSTTPAAGSTVSVPMTSLTVVFNEAYLSSSINDGNLMLNEGNVTGFTLVNSTTVTYSLNGLTSASSLSVSIKANAISDTNGGGNAAFAESFTLVTGLIEGLPAGSLVYEAEDGGDIATGGSSQSFSFNFAAGQIITAVVDPSSLRNTKLVVTGPGISGSLSATGTQHNDVAIQDIVATTSGTYTFTTSSTSTGITGSYELEVFLNAGVSTSGIGSTSNNTFSTAQRIDTSSNSPNGVFTSIGPTATRGAVVGRIDALNNGKLSDFYSFNLTAGQTVTLGVADDSGASGTINVSLLNSSDTTLATGIAETSVDGAVENFTVTTSGTYYAQVTGNAGVLYVLVITESADFDMKGNSTQSTAQNISGTDGVLGAITSSSPDWYAVNLTAGSALNLQTYTFGSPNNSYQFVDSVQPQVAVYNSSGTLIASGTGSPNQTLTADAATSGTYYVEVTGGSGSTGEYFLSTQIDPTAPAITGVYVGSTAWTSAFMSYLASDGIGSSTLGYLIPAGSSQLTDLPWVNINTISVVFNENVSINTADSALALVGSPDLPAPASLSSATFSYSSTTHTATWTFSSSFATDKYLINIPAADVTDSFGTQLAGEWTNGTSSYPSGNGTVPGTFDFQFNILHGDVNQDGVVNGADGNAVRLKLLQNVNTSGYSPFYDVAGTGSITGADGSYVRINLTATLPPDNPSPPGGSGALPDGATPGGIAATSGGTLGNSLGAAASTTAASQPAFGAMQLGLFTSIPQPVQSASGSSSQISAAGNKNVLDSESADLDGTMFELAIDDVLPAMPSETLSAIQPNAFASLGNQSPFTGDFATLATVPSAAIGDSAGGGKIDGDSGGEKIESSRANSNTADQDSLADYILEQQLDWLLE